MVNNVMTTRVVLTPRDAFLIRISRTAAGLGALIGFAILIGWLFNIPWLKNDFSTQVTTKVNTGLGFILSGVALWLQLRAITNRQRWLARVFAGVVMLIGLLTLAEYLFKLDIGIDHLIIQERPQDTKSGYPGRMALLTALNFVLIGVALLSFERRTHSGYRPAQGFAAISGLISLFAFTGYYFYNLESFYKQVSYTPMGPYAAALFGLLCFGIVFGAKGGGFAAILSGDSSGGLMARRLFPTMLALLGFLGWSVLEGTRLRIYDDRAAVMVFATLTAVMQSILIWWNALSLNRIDRERQQANEALRKAHDELEIRVLERTAALEQTNRKLQAEIRERQQIEVALETERNQLRALLDNIPASVFLKDLNGRYVLCNTLHANLMNVSSIDDVIGKTVADLLSSDQVTQYLADDQAVMDSHKVIANVERIAITTDGQKRHLWVTKVPIFDNQREITGILGITLDVTERKQAEDALQAERNLLRTLIDNVPDYIFVKDVEGRFMSSNMAHARSGGVATPAELIGKTAFDLYPADLAARFHADDVALMETGEELINAERHTVDAAGNDTLVLTTKIPLRDRDGNINGLVGISRDITDYRAAQEALSQSEARFQMVAKATNDAVWDWNLVTDALWWNHGIQQFGYTAQEIDLHRSSWMNHIHLDDQAMITQSIQAALDHSDQSWGEEYRFRRADGTYANIFDRGFIIRDESGKPLRMIGAMMDISERKQTERQIKESEERFRALAEYSSHIITIREPNGVIRYVSPSIEQVLGYAPEEVIGRAGFESIHPDDLVKLKDDPNTQIMVTETRYRHKDGSWRVLENVRQNLLDNPAIAGIVINSRDITERKLAEETLALTLAELTRSNEELQQFAYVASHDLQEPLRMVGSYVQLLSRRYSGKLDPEADEFIAYAVDGATRMQRLIQDLLAYSRVGTRAKPFEVVDCEMLLDQVLANLKIAIAEQQAVIHHEPLPKLMADNTQLMTVFQNLIGNAIKFHGDIAPIVHITAEQNGNEWLFSVRDNGIGIDPKYMDRLFIIFKRLHTKAEYPGTGIGLAICKKVIERHSGRIWIESEAGKGATFFFTLPVRRFPVAEAVQQ
jgi:PAS domain S-box-containing protein